MKGGLDGTTLVAIGASVVSFLGVLLTVLSQRRERRDRARIEAEAERNRQEATRRAAEAEERRQALNELDVTNQRLAAENTRLAALRLAADERADNLERDLDRARRTTEETNAALTGHLVSIQARATTLEAICRANGLDVPQ